MHRQYLLECFSKVPLWQVSASSGFYVMCTVLWYETPIRLRYTYRDRNHFQPFLHPSARLTRDIFSFSSLMLQSFSLALSGPIRPLANTVPVLFSFYLCPSLSFYLSPYISLSLSHIHTLSLSLYLIVCSVFLLVFLSL